MSQVTFWHSGIDRVCNGTLTGNERFNKVWIAGGWFLDGKLIEVRWSDGNSFTYTTWIRDTAILDIETPYSEPHNVD